VTSRARTLMFLVCAPFVIGVLHLALFFAAVVAQLEICGTDGDSGPTWVGTVLLFPLSMLPADWRREQTLWHVPINSLVVGCLITGLIVFVNRRRPQPVTRAGGTPA